MKITRVIPLLSCGLLMLAFSTAYANMNVDYTSNKAFEIRFMEDMADHHMEAVEEGNLCLQRAAKKELKDKCGEIVSSQTKEIQELKSYLMQWYGIDYRPRVRDDGKMMLKMLKSKSGEEFDKMFMMMMSNHHRLAILMSADALILSYHPKLLDLARDIAVTQAAEIREFRQWLCDWYKMCVIELERGIM